MRVLGLAVRRSRVPVLVNVSHSSLAHALELAGHALDTGAAGILLMPPYFYRYNDGQILRFYEDFAGTLRGAIPLYLYNLPFFTNPVSQEVALELLGSQMYQGIKDSSGEWPLFAALLELRTRTPFSLLAGNELIYLRARAGGADGIVSGVAAALPELMVALDRAIVDKDNERARHLNGHLQTFLEWIGRFPASVGIKQAAAARGWIVDHLHVPLDRRTGAEAGAYRVWFDRWLPEVLADCSRAIPVRA